MANGTQMALKVKKNKLNNSSQWFTSGQKLDRSFQAAVFLCTYFYFKNHDSIIFYILL